jgi:hypothetical protein
VRPPEEAALVWVTAGTPVPAAAPEPARSTYTATPPRNWRDTLAAFGQELVRGQQPEPPVVPQQTELSELADRLALSPQARRVLTTLYAVYLNGEPSLSLARLARLLGDWTEALGQGELGALAMLERDQGKVALARPVTDLLDGAPPREIRIVGGAPTTPHAGAFRVARDRRSDAEIEAELAAQLGRIAIALGPLPAALLEAMLHGATAVTLVVPGERPRPWPRGAGLVLVLYGTTSSWVADVPSL